MELRNVMVKVTGDSGGEVEHFSYFPVAVGEEKREGVPNIMDEDFYIGDSGRYIHVLVSDDMQWKVINDKTEYPWGDGFKTEFQGTPFIMSDDVMAAAIDVAKAFAFPQQYMAAIADEVKRARDGKINQAIAAVRNS